MRILSLVIVLCLSTFATPAFCAGGDQYNADLSGLENRFFLCTYPNDTVTQRLDRLDTLVFGRVRQGSNQERMTRLLLDVPKPSSSSTGNGDNAGTAPDGTSTGSGPSSDSTASANNYSNYNQTNNTNPPYDQSNGTSAAQGPLAYSGPGTTADTYSNSGNGADSRFDQMNSSPDQASGGTDQTADGYPTVTALEKQITGKPQPSLPLGDRLAKLETIAFGKPSQGDFADRVDRLKQYVSTKYGGNENYLTSPNAVGWNNGPTGLASEVGSMEQQVFGKTYTRDNLSSRLTRLEKAVLPQQPAQTFTPVQTRVNKLMAALNPSLQQPSVAQYPSFATSQQDVLSGTQATPAQKPKHHSFLHTLGTVAGEVGGLAERSMMYGGYGYGW